MLFRMYQYITNPYKYVGSRSVNSIETRISNILKKNICFFAG